MNPSFLANELSAFRAGVADIREDHFQSGWIPEFTPPIIDVVCQTVVSVAPRELDFALSGRDLRYAPVCDVQVVYAPVDNKSNAVIADQIPIRPRVQDAVIRAHLRGAHIPIEIKAIRDGFFGGRVHVGSLVVRTRRCDFYGVHLADVAIAGQFTRQPKEKA